MLVYSQSMEYVEGTLQYAVYDHRIDRKTILWGVGLDLHRNLQPFGSQSLNIRHYGA
jgi:hypothetical protein